MFSRRRREFWREPRLSAALCVAALAATALAGDQPQWGQRWSRNMVSDEKGLPETFDPKTGKNIKWSVRLGTSTHSTPVVAKGKVLIGTNNARPRDPRHKGDRGVLMCLDEANGRLLWQLVVPKREKDPYLDWPGIGITSAATVEGERVYLVSNRGEVVCLDLEGLADGNDGPYRDEGRHMARQGEPPMEPAETDADIIWIFDMAGQAGAHQHDAANCSVLVDEQFVYACTSNGVDNTHKRLLKPEAPSLVVLEKKTGRYVARDGAQIGRLTIHSMWSSPSSGNVGGRRLVFFGGGDGVCYAFQALSEVPAGKLPGRIETVWQFDCDPAGPKENHLAYQDNFQEGPSNISGMAVFHEGRVYVTAGGDIWHGKREAWIKCIDASKTGDITKSGEIWSQPLKRHCISTPAIHDGLLYIADCGRQISCLDAETGRIYWTHETKGDIWGSTLVADGKVYVGARRGDFWILAAGKEKRVIGSVNLGRPINSSPTVANGVLYIATMSHLYAVQKSP